MCTIKILLSYKIRSQIQSKSRKQFDPIKPKGFNGSEWRPGSFALLRAISTVSPIAVRWMGNCRSLPSHLRTNGGRVPRNRASYINAREKLREDWAELGLHETGFGELGEAVDPKRRRPPCLRPPAESARKIIHM